MTNNNGITFKTITLSDKEIIDRYTKNSTNLCSDLTFTNLFMWRKAYNIRFSEAEGNLLIAYRHGSSPETICRAPRKDSPFPASALKALSEKYGSGLTLKIYGETELSAFEATFPDIFDITEDRDSFDYVYSVKSLTELSGKAYHSKKNHINKFKSLYSFKYEHMTPEYRPVCKELFDKWYRDKAGTVEGIDEQLEAVSELLDNWERLDIVGGCITVDGSMAAFSFGEPLCSDPSCAVIHLEHADTSYQGSYAAINQMFLEHEFGDLEYVNREEDMGLEGLRRAKLSYKPAFMAKKYTAVLKRDILRLSV